jgi:UDP-glucuronate decarboxylase
MKETIQKNEGNFKKLIKERKRVLITGGAGFIGSNLIRKLLKKDYQVICLDNLFSSRKENVFEFMDNKNFEFIRADVINPFNFEVDEIYNLACPASPVYYQKDPVYTIKTSFYGALNVLDNAKRTGAKVLQASTSEIYGLPEEHPQNENYWGNVNLIGPRSCYDEGKRAVETLFFDYYREYNTRIKVVRIFNTYGPKMSPNDGRVITNFILQALQGKDITIYGDGEQTRSFCYVDDLTGGLIKTMEEDYFTGPVNLGNPDERSILSVAKTIIRFTDSSSKIIYLPRPEDDPQRRVPDISLATSTLNWSPSTGFEEGIKNTINYFKKLYF